MQCCTTSGLLGAEFVAEPARGLELDQRGEPLLHRLVGALGPVLRRLGAVPGGGVDQAERGGARRMPRGEGERHHAAHRGAGDQRLVPAEMRRACRRCRRRTARRCRARPACRRRHGRGSRRSRPRYPSPAAPPPAARTARSIATECTSAARRGDAGVAVQGVGNTDAVAGAGTAVSAGGAAKVGVQRIPLLDAGGYSPIRHGASKDLRRYKVR